jgi:xylose isomerase
MTEIRLAAIVGLYNQMSDRFMTIGYGEDRDLITLVRLAAKQGLVDGLEFSDGVGGLNKDNLQEIQQIMADYGLAFAGISPNLWGERQWGKGTLGASDPAVRQKAQDRIRQVMDMAATVGCDYVGLWPGQDGFDYPFEVDYRQVYDWWVRGVQACADHNRDVRLGLEFKPYEPRTHSFLDTAAKTLLLLENVNRPNTGVCLDVGHAFYGHENLGEVVALSQRNDRLFHLHFNDNYGDWDWDLNVGSVHFIAYVELMYWLKRTGYRGWYSMDLFSYRADPFDSMAESIEWVKSFNRFVDEVGQEQFNSFIEAGDPIAMSRFFRERLF